MKFMKKGSKSIFSEYWIGSSLYHYIIPIIALYVISKINDEIVD